MTLFARLGWSLSRLARDLSDTAFLFLPDLLVRGLATLGARSVGVCSKDVKWRMQRTHLEEKSCKRGIVGAGSAGRIYRSDFHISCWSPGLGRLA